MANVIMNTVYNQFLTTYAPKKSDTRFDTHKRSELRSICNSMVKVNRDAPLYKIDNSNETKQYIIGIKEEARQLHNIILSIAGNNESADLNNKVAYTSNENIVSAKYVGENTQPLLANSTYDSSTDGVVTSKDAEVPTYNIEVTSLASPQVNLGKYLAKDSLDIAPGDYSFDVTVNEQGYEFQYTIHEDDTNVDVQNRLSRLINNSGIHLTSSVEEDENGHSSLKISSSQIGINFGQKTKVFSIADSTTSKISGSVSYFGIDYVAREASNAHFKVNGIDASSASNTFTLEKQYELTLNGISPTEGETVSIGVKPDTEAFVDNLSNLIGGYNHFIQTINEFRDTQARSKDLIHEMKGLADYYSSDMNKIGISITEDGTLNLDKDECFNNTTAEDLQDTLSVIKKFSGSMLRKSNQISLNPVSYVNKTVVAYKNPGKSFLSPYVASAYAGMIFNSFC